jgi:serine/threonine protein kinase
VATFQTGSKIGCYELIRLLGAGGMGEVWEAHDIPADRPVALKFIKPDLLSRPGFRARFVNEAKTLGKLEQDRIVTLYTVLEEGEHLALVLRFIDGQPLSDRIETQGALPVDFVLSCARDILPALDFAHERGVIHRDIKPQNILVTRQGRCFLTDFGIAVTSSQERVTLGGAAIGTPYYMSPEQITKPSDLTMEKRGYRTDIYSFGVVLFEMLTGRLPFGHDSGIEETFSIQQKHCFEPPPSLRTLRGDIPPAIEAVVLRSLEKDPAARPQNCSELLAELEAAARGAMPRPTVLEGSGSVGRKTVVIPESEPIKSKRGIPKLAWLGSAAVILAVAIGAAVWAAGSRHGQPVDTKPVSTTTPAPQPLAPGPNRPAKSEQASALNRQAQQLYGGGRPCEALTKLNQAIALFPQPEYIHDQSAFSAACQQANPQKASTNLPTANPQAAALDREAEQLYQSGEYCTGLDKLDQAIVLDRRQEYVSRRNSFVTACNLSRSQ